MSGGVHCMLYQCCTVLQEYTVDKSAHFTRRGTTESRELCACSHVKLEQPSSSCHRLVIMPLCCCCRSASLLVLAVPMQLKRLSGTYVWLPGNLSPATSTHKRQSQRRTAAAAAMPGTKHDDDDDDYVDHKSVSACPCVLVCVRSTGTQYKYK